MGADTTCDKQEISCSAIVDALMVETSLRKLRVIAIVVYVVLLMTWNMCFFTRSTWNPSTPTRDFEYVFTRGTSSGNSLLRDR